MGELLYFSLLAILSLNAIFNFINTNRNFGKTWAIQIRTWRRAYKRGKKAILIRRFKKEVKEQVRKLYSSPDLCAKLKGFIPYDAKTGKGNFKRNGNIFYIKRGGRWEWFLQVVALSDSNAMRSADDVNIDTIYFDEYTTTPRRYSAYRGNEVEDFIDIFYSIKREHKVRCFFFGNRESVTNPYFKYFGIRSMPSTYEGIRRYKNGTIAVQYINNKQKEKSDFDRQLKDLFAGTKYGDYIYKSEYKTQTAYKRAKTPKNAAEYISIYWDGTPFTISFYDGHYYVKRGVDKSRPIYCDVTTGIYPREFRLIRTQKRLFDAFTNALSLNIVQYENAETYEAIQPFIKWLSI